MRLSCRLRLFLLKHVHRILAFVGERAGEMTGRSYVSAMPNSAAIKIDLIKGGFSRNGIAERILLIGFEDAFARELLKIVEDSDGCAEIGREMTVSGALDSVKSSVWDLILFDWSYAFRTDISSFYERIREASSQSAIVVVVSSTAEAIRVDSVMPNADFVVKRARISPALLQRIRHQHAALEAMAAERDFSDTIFNAIGSLVAVSTPAGDVIRVNSTFESVTGYAQAEVFSRSFWDVFVDDGDIRAEKAYFKNLDMMARHCAKEARIRTKSGDVRYVSWTCNAHLDDDGEVEYVISSGVDVTQAREFERKQRESEERFVSAFHSSPSQISVSTLADGLHRDVNRMWLETMGFERDEVIGKGALELGIWVDVKDRKRLISDIKAHGQIRDFETQFHTKSGEIRDFMLSGTKVTMDGQACLLLVNVDITARKRMEAAEREKNALSALLNAITQAGGNTVDVDEIMATCLREVCLFTGWPVGHVYKLDALDKRRLASSSIWHFRNSKKYAPFRRASTNLFFTKGAGLPGRTFELGEPLWIKNIKVEQGFPRAAVAAECGLHDAFALPILIRGKVVAVLEFFAPGIPEPSEAFVQAMRLLDTQVGRVIERAQADVALREAHDELETRVIERTNQLREEVEERSRIQEALVESEQRFKDMVEAGSDWIWEMDSAGRFTYFSESFRTVMGVDPAKYLHGKREIFRAPEEDLQNQNWREHLASLKDRKPFRNFQYAVMRPDKTILHINVSGKPVFDEAGVFMGYRGTGSNVTEKVLAERVILRTKEEAELANQSKSEFLANMSHELRTPLNAIIGFSDVIKMDLFGKLENDHYRDYIDHIHTSGQHLLGLINDVLDVSKIEAGAMDLFEEEISPALLVASIQPLIEQQANDKAIILRITAGEQLPQVRMDERRIKQVLLNLLSNAVKFTSEKGHVSLDVWRDGSGCMTFQVSDTGIGMSVEEVETSLSTFGQVDNVYSRTQDGSGLGLPLSKGLVVMHGGTMTIDSTPGKGTQVTVRLPVGRVVS